MPEKLRLPLVNPENYTGWDPIPDAIEVIDDAHYIVIEGTSLGGDAPKDLIAVYEEGKNCDLNNTATWIKYIAKSSSKWYPMEGITEYLLTTLGKDFGVNIVECRLAIIGGQVRFLSKYFLGTRDYLHHGASIYAALSDSVELETAEKAEWRYFPVRVIREALNSYYGIEFGEKMYENYHKMLVFDAWVGNNDRHFSNWGIIHPDHSEFKLFSPVYDTARGLLWNYSEERLQNMSKSGQGGRAALLKYCNSSRPKTSVDGTELLTHYDFILKLKNLEPPLPAETEGWEIFGIPGLPEPLIPDFNEVLTKAENTINEKFSLILSPLRKQMILFILRERTEKLLQIFNTLSNE
ncbi:MAG: HipA domain-containing protein [Bacteroidota bacterium]